MHRWVAKLRCVPTCNSVSQDDLTEVVTLQIKTFAWRVPAAISLIKQNVQFGRKMHLRVRFTFWYIFLSFSPKKHDSYLKNVNQKVHKML